VETRNSFFPTYREVIAAQPHTHIALDPQETMATFAVPSPSQRSPPSPQGNPRIQMKRNRSASTALSLLGLDIGGTLAKLCIFEMNEIPNARAEYIRANATFGETGIRNSDLTIQSAACGGKIYFVTFETRRMEGAIELIRSLDLHVGIQSMYATGGGAHKYAQMFRDGLGIELQQKDELETVVSGLRFVVSELNDAVYTLSNVDFSTPGAQPTERVPVSLRESMFPFVLCNIGSGVSIVQVKGRNQIQRISGTALGGSTFFGLCRLLTKAKDFSESMNLADEGDGSKVNLLVRDIYGGNYKQFGLAGDLTASFFGKVAREENPRENISDADIARALVIMITQNISQIAFLNARACHSERVIFTGSFLRSNNIACRTLAYGMMRWSQLGGRPIQPLFLKHEGCLGALGAFLSNYNFIHDSSGPDPPPPPTAISGANAGGTKTMLEDAQKRVAELQEQLERELAEKGESEGATEGESKGE